MKKMIMTFAVFCAITSVFAQKTKLGIRAGINLANFTTSGAGVEIKNKLGADAALLVEFAIDQKFSVQPEIGYSGYGIRLRSGDVKGSYNLNYVVIPVLAKFNTAEGLSVFAGPAAAIMLSAEAKLNDGTPKQDMKEYLTSSDFFAVMGVEYNMPVGISFGVRYNHGLTHINRQPDVKISNRSVGISVGYKFGLRR